MNYNISEINPDHKSWPNLLKTAAMLGPRKSRWLSIQADYHLSSHTLVAVFDEQIIGFLRFSIRRLGVAEARPTITFKDNTLIEAKVIAFAVVPDYRNQGIGRTLQETGMKLAKSRGCYQYRSRSHYRSKANYHLKISMGFAIQPSLEDDSVYFVKTLDT